MFKGVLIGLSIALLAMLIFQAGMFFGYRKAAFSYGFGDHYYRVFAGPGGMGDRVFQISLHDKFMEGNGAAGKIVSINLPTFVVSERDNMEKTVFISTSTQIRSFDKTIQPSDLKPDDFVIVFGSPDNDSQIEARLIRLLPPPQSTTSIKNF